MAEQTCDFCGEPIEAEDESLRRGNRIYCSQACAFEATRSADCAGRTDSVMSEKKTESAE